VEAVPARKPVGRPRKVAKDPVAVAPEIRVIEQPAVAPKAQARPEPPRGDLFTGHVKTLAAAIQEGRAIELIFSDADANPPRTFEPRHLVLDALSKCWFVWGWDRRYNAQRHHRLDHLAEVNAVEGVGRAAQGPYKEDTPANLIGGWLGGEPIQVKAVLHKQWIFAVRQAPAPFPEFRMEDLEEGKAQITFQATDLRAIAQWVMQFGDGIQVLEPQRLLDRIKQVGLAWAGKAATQPAPKSPAPDRSRNEKPERGERSDRGERSERSDRGERSERSDRGERPERNDRGERPERNERNERPERHDRPERAERADRTEKADRFERPAREDAEAAKPKPGKIEIRIDRL
jgi:hypothetical protein